MVTYPIILLSLVATLFAADRFPSAPAPAADWIWLFDGAGTSQWTSAKSDRFPAQGWAIVDRTLVVNAGGDKSRRGGDIITRREFGNFELEFEFRLGPGANSGLKYLVKKYPDGSMLGPEYQIIDDVNNPDIAADKDDKRRTAGLYELIAPSARKLNPIGQWNQGRVVVNGKRIEHWLNGTKVVEIERGSPAFLAARAASKFKAIDDFGLVDKGYILLQDHGDESAFRRIRIREL